MAPDSTHIGSMAADDRIEEVEDGLPVSGRMGFLDHLDELRRRIVYSLWAILACLAVTFWFWQPMFTGLVEYFQANSNGGQVIYTKATSGFMFSLKLSALAALVVSSPFVFSQIWFFVAPGLYSREKRMAIPFVFFSSLL